MEDFFKEVRDLYEKSLDYTWGFPIEGNLMLFIAYQLYKNGNDE